MKYKPEEIAILASLNLSNEAVYILNKFSHNILKTENIILVPFLNNKLNTDSLWINANIKGVFENIIINNKKSQDEIIKDIKRGKIKALYLTERLDDLRLLKGVDFLIVQDIYPSDCLQNADVVLPTNTFIEDSGSFFDIKQKLNKFYQVTPTLDRSKPDWQIFSELAKVFDNSKEKEFQYSTPNEITKEISKRSQNIDPNSSHNLMKNLELSLFSFEEHFLELINKPSMLESFRYRGEKLSNQVPDLKQLLEYRTSKGTGEKSKIEKEKPKPKRTRFKVISNKEIAIDFYKLIIKAPLIAKKVKPGNFLILMKEETSERIPLTISDWDALKGTLTLYYQETGYSTMELTDLKAEDYIFSVVGPLGNEIQIENFGTVLLAGGCYGNGAIYPIAKALKSVGNSVIVILEGRNENLFYLEEDFKKISDQIIYCTSDGSKGLKGKILTGLEHVFNQDIKIDRSYFIGCTYMMRDASNFTKEHGNVPTFVSLNTIMIDGTGLCGCCRLTLIQDGKETTKFACIDGPLFNGHHVKWDELVSLNVRFQESEISIYQTHSCKAVDKFNTGDKNE